MTQGSQDHKCRAECSYAVNKVNSNPGIPDRRPQATEDQRKIWYGESATRVAHRGADEYLEIHQKRETRCEADHGAVVAD